MARDTLRAILARAPDGEDLAISMKAVLIDDEKAAFAIPAIIEVATIAALFLFPFFDKSRFDDYRIYYRSFGND